MVLNDETRNIKNAYYHYIRSLRTDTDKRNNESSDLAYNLSAVVNIIHTRTHITGTHTHAPHTQNTQQGNKIVSPKSNGPWTAVRVLPDLEYSSENRLLLAATRITGGSEVAGHWRSAGC